MKVKSYAAIDIGSNAVRLLIKNVIETTAYPPHYKKVSMTRVPIRLGGDVFVHGSILKENKLKLQQTMHAFKTLMNVHDVKEYKACATSAMRAAKNGKSIAEEIKINTGIEIEIIDGQHEASYIAQTDLREMIKIDKTYLYVDVGGGSTEFTVYSDGEAVASNSFDLGTVRILNQMIDDKHWRKAQNWVEKHTAEYESIRMIGSGGNINHIFKRSGKKRGKPLKYKHLDAYRQKIKALTFEERLTELDMKLDRADVVLPAIELYLSAMEWSGAKNIYVPKIGLADGIIKTLYRNDDSSL